MLPICEKTERGGRPGAGLGKGEWRRLHVPHGIGSGLRLRGPIQPARHEMARNLDRLQNDPQGTPFREDEESPQGDALYLTPDGTDGNVPRRL